MRRAKREFEYELKLFVSGASPNSARAITNLQTILETHLSGRYSLTITDVRQEAAVAVQEQIIALPLLIKVKPEPSRKMIGDMSNTQKVLDGLGLTDK
jgi:circadian clock protein KaiB